MAFDFFKLLYDLILRLLNRRTHGDERIPEDVSGIRFRVPGRHSTMSVRRTGQRHDPTIHRGMSREVILGRGGGGDPRLQYRDGACDPISPAGTLS